MARREANTQDDVLADCTPEVSESAIYTYTYIYIYIYIYICTHIHTYARTHVHTYIHACMRACIHIHIHIHTHTHIHSYIHTYFCLICRATCADAERGVFNVGIGTKCGSRIEQCQAVLNGTETATQQCDSSESSLNRQSCAKRLWTREPTQDTQTARVLPSSNTRKKGRTREHPNKAYQQSCRL